MESDLEARERELNEMIVARKHAEAFEKFYADDCEMQENSDPPTRGKDANREREKNLFVILDEFHSIELKASAVGDHISFSEWRNEMTLEGIGRVTTEQTAVRRWKNGQVVNERFYYKPAWTTAEKQNAKSQSESAFGASSFFASWRLGAFAPLR